MIQIDINHVFTADSIRFLDDIVNFLKLDFVKFDPIMEKCHFIESLCL